MEVKTENLQNSVISPQERQEFEEFKRQKRVSEARSVISRLELSFDKPVHDRAALRVALNDARRIRLGGICVSPCMVRPCAQMCGEGFAPAIVACLSVWGGTDTTDVKVKMVKRAVRDGADAVEVTAPIPAIKEGNWTYVRRELKKLSRTAKRTSLRLNLEAPLLTESELSRLCSIACEIAIPCLRTASGAFGSGADEEDLATIATAVKERAHIKADGADMPGRIATLLDLGATIIGSADAVSLAQAILSAAES